jgi:tetratricopeptide (TPR) repeat protein
LSLAAKQNDRASIFFANYWLANAFWFNCKFERAIRHVQKALEINLAAKSRWGVAAMQSQLSWIYVTAGDVGLGYELAQDAVRLAEESEDIYAKSWAYCYPGISLHYKGDLDQAIDDLSRAVEYSKKASMIANYRLSCYHLGLIFREIGERELAEEHFVKAVRVGETNVHQYMSEGQLVIEKARIGEADIDMRFLEDYRRRQGIKPYHGGFNREVADALLTMGDDRMSEAENWIQEAIEADRRNGTRWDLAMDYAHYAELFKQRGDVSTAREHLNKAIEIFQECGADGWVKRTEEKLAQL